MDRRASSGYLHLIQDHLETRSIRSATIVAAENKYFRLHAVGAKLSNSIVIEESQNGLLLMPVRYEPISVVVVAPQFSALLLRPTIF